MKKINLYLLMAFLFLAYNSNAQLEFKIKFDFDTERYIVSVIPQATYTEPQNITGTGQVTIKVPTNEFIPVDIVNLLEGMKWEANSRNDAPSESPEYDYISFALQMQGLGYPDYEEGVELPLFSFQNAFGCTGDSKVYLVDNETDPFMPPNSENANVGNTLTILGAGGDAYAGLYNGGVASCDPQNPTSTAEELGFAEYSVFPNPVVDEINVSVEWNGESADAMIQVVDAAGKLVLAEPFDIVNGKNNKKLNVERYPAGSYFLYLVAEDWEVSLDKVTKQ
ncbi:MAG TPA: T9SS type A sorting domain-containing protein [Bacteroidetes bacterium]|nr:T9SS type A sorting domain-containing protein [Bacteroidota bacterium]